jgi:hypothetical protein
MATASTLGDFVWATWITAHRGVYGMTHGILLFVIAGLVLGVPANRAAAGAIAGALVGALGAGSFYLLAPLLGYSAMFVSWFGLWFALAIAHLRLNARPLSVREIALRGGLAGATSGVAFYAISGIWRPFDPSGWDYAVHFGAWTIAYLPGFVSLFALLPAKPGSGKVEKWRSGAASGKLKVET